VKARMEEEVSAIFSVIHKSGGCLLLQPLVSLLCYDFHNP
jgi:hypothetical protein